MNDKSPGIRLGDLAREAKVSAATVSRFMGGSAEVSPETSKRIIRAAKLLGFDLGGGKKSRIIAFLLSNRGVLHTLHSSILIGAHNYCAEHNYGVLFLSFKYLLCTPSGELELPEILQNKQTVAGVILAGANSESLLHLLSKRRMPWAALGNNVFGDVQDQAGMVYFDDFGGAYDLTRYLQSLGHRHIGFIGSQSFPWYVRRYEAYERAMKDAGLAVRCCDLNVLQSGGEMGYLATKLMLQESPPPTAFFAADDALAGGAYKAIRDSGLSVPEDISVVGFNDSIEASFLHPPLTSVKVFADEIGRQLAETLLDRIARPDLPARSLVIPTQLMRRESCAMLPEANLSRSSGSVPAQPGLLKAPARTAMESRWELTDKEWSLVEPVLCPVRREDHRGRPWHDTRAVLNGVFWILGSGAQWAEMPAKYPPYQTCHRRFQRWIREGKLVEALGLLAKHLHARGKLHLDELFMDANSHGETLSLDPLGAVEAQELSLSPLVTVFLSPCLSKALGLPSADLWKRFWLDASLAS